MPADPASAAIVDLYERNADGWLRDRGTSLHERAWLDRFTAPLAPGASILDIGCGSGEPLARHLIERGFKLTGVDSSPSMIENAAHRLPAGRWMVKDMRALDLGRRFDALLAWHSFFHLSPDDQRAMFLRFAGLGAPGAMLIFTSGRAHSEEIGQWRGEPLYHGSLDPGEYRALLDANGFDLAAHKMADPDCGDSTVWLARLRP